MIPAEPIILIILRGEERIFNADGHYDILTMHTGGGTVVTVRDCSTDEILYDELSVEYVTISAPFVYIQTEKV
ncbi:MAG TPA: hypothetical protein [Siphovirus UK_ancient_CT89]|nr:MAG TPA: hypothetical protein [Siphovirus UK_ancient_CT89]